MRLPTLQAQCVHTLTRASLVLALVATSVTPAAWAQTSAVVTAPILLGLTPNFGRVSGGNRVTLTATNVAEPTAVTFGSAAATVVGYTQQGAMTRIVVDAPPGEGVVDVTVTSPAGTSAITEQDEYSYAPELTSITPDAGPAGTQVMIDGNNLLTRTGGAAVTSVDFGGVAATGVQLIRNGVDGRCGAGIPRGTPCVRAAVPPGSGVVDVTLSGPDGTSDVVPGDGYSYGPVLTRLSPSAGPAGTRVAIFGNGLATQQAALISGVNFGDVPATDVQVVRQHTSRGVSTAGCGRGVADGVVCVLATAPAGTGVVDVTLVGSGGTSPITPADEYSYAPEIGSLSPDFGRTGTRVTIITTSVRGFGRRAITGVNFGAVPATGFDFGTPGVGACPPDVPRGALCVVATAPPGEGVVDVTLVGPGGTSQSGPQDQFSYAPVVTSIRPNAGPAGTSVAILGDNFARVTAVSFGGTPASKFVLESRASDLEIQRLCGAHPEPTGCIVAVAPAGNGVVDVTLTAPGGTSDTGPQAQYSYTPRVESIAPAFGPAVGGTRVTIRGAGFARSVNGHVTGVLFGSRPSPSWAVLTDDRVEAFSPTGVGIVDVTVQTTYGTSVATAADEFTYVGGRPVIESLTPDSGSTAGNTPVVIRGAGFTGALSVMFGSASAARFSVDSDVQITATTPPGVGRVGVTVATPFGTSPQDVGYTYVAQPRVTQVTPAAGPLGGGTQVVVSGSGFTGATQVQFGSVPAQPFVVNSDTQITTFSPPGSGTVDVSVIGPGGASPGVPADQFTYLAAPTLTSIAPAAGPVTGGTSVVLTGSGFTGATAVLFGPTPATNFTVNSDAQITATSPAGRDIVLLSVTTPGGASAGTPADHFHYLPVVASISPGQGPAAGGTPVTITGAGLLEATSVTFGGVPAGFDSPTTDTQLVAIAPPGTGMVDVVVSAPAGDSPVVSADQFAYIPAPAITLISPNQGPVTGGTSVTLSGSAFTGVTGVLFGATAAASFAVTSDSQLTAVSPPGAGSVDIRVTTPGGISAKSAADVFAYVPVVTTIAPTQGPTRGGVQVTITGAGFLAATAVYFGGVPASGFTTTSDNQIIANAPPGTGVVDVVVANSAGASASVPADQFTYVAAPTVTSLSPNSGPAGGGSRVLVSGASFTGATAVKFGAAAASTFTVNSDTSITAYAPAGAGSVDVTVTTAGGTSPTSAADQFTYLGTGPAITAVDPNSGPPAGGSAVTITGTRFTGATAVQFGTTPAAGFSVVSDTQINAVSPGVANPGVVDIRVTTPTGTSAVTSTDQFNYANGGRGYVANAADDTISVFDTATNQVIRTMSVPPAPDQPGVTPALAALVVSPDGEVVYVAGQNNNTIYQVDAVSGAVRATFNTLANGGACGPMGLALTPDGTRLYVEGASCLTVSVLDTSGSGRISLVANVANVAEGGKAAVSALVGQAFFANTGPGGGLVVLDTRTNTVVQTYLGSQFYGVAVAQGGASVWFAGGTDVEFRQINGCCNSAGFGLGSALRGVATPAGGNDMAAIADGTNTLWILTNNGEDISQTPVSVGNGPLNTAVSADGSLAYVSNRLDNTVSVVDTNADAVVATIGVGKSPTDIGVTNYVPPGG